MIKDILSDTPALTTVMHVDGGEFLDSSESLPLVWIVFTGRFLEQPTGDFYETEYVSGSGSGDDLKNMHHGQTRCEIEDFTANQGANTTAYTFDLTEFHDYKIYNDDTNMYIEIDSSTERTVNCPNGFDATTGLVYKWHVFDGAKIYLKDMTIVRRTVAGGTENGFSWDFESGDSVPSGWSNSTIKYVIG